MDIDALLDRYGLAFVFVGCFVEGDTVALTAGVLEHQGLLPFWPTVLAAAAGGWTWDIAIFALGRGFRAHPRVARALSHPRAQALTRRLLRWPVVLAAVFRFIPATRTVAPLALATASTLSMPLYAAITLVSAMLWALILVTIGHDLGQLIDRLWGDMQDIRPILLIPCLSIAGIAIWTGMRIRRRKRIAWERAQDPLQQR